MKHIEIKTFNRHFVFNKQMKWDSRFVQMKKEGSAKPFRKSDEKQTAAGKTQRHTDVITFFRTSSTITVQMPPQITWYGNTYNSLLD